MAKSSVYEKKNASAERSAMPFYVLPKSPSSKL